MLISKRSLILGAGAMFITRRALSYPVRLNNPLAYPAGVQPGINQSHVAGGHIGFSGVTIGKSFARLNSIAFLGLTGSPTTSIDSQIGPTLSFTSTQSAQAGGNNTVLSGGMALAAIFRLPASAPGSNAFIVGDTNFTNIYISSGSFTINGNLVNSAAIIPNITLIASRAYFVVMAVTGTTNPVSVYFYVRDLGTGQVYTAINSASTGISAAATVFVGNRSSGAGPFTGNIATAAILLNAPNRLAINEWGQAPFDFWFPPTQQNVMMSGLRSSAAIAANSQQPMLFGVGP